MKGKAPRYCLKCQKKFDPVNNTQKFCQDPCSARKSTIALSNAKWASREIKKKKTFSKKSYLW
jgi:hypothetical protein